MSAQGEGGGQSEVTAHNRCSVLTPAHPPRVRLSVILTVAAPSASCQGLLFTGRHSSSGPIGRSLPFLGSVSSSINKRGGWCENGPLTIDV